MTSHAPDYYIKIFESFGHNLFEAAMIRDAKFGASGQAADPKAIAQSVAELLTKSVQGGINIGGLLEIAKQGDKAESLRIAATALAAQSVGKLAQEREALPDTPDLEAMTQCYSTVIEISQHFESSPEAELRLSTLEASGSIASVYLDQLQSRLQILMAFEPVIIAVQSAPLGQDPQGLIKDIHAKLSAKARDLAVLLKQDLDLALTSDHNSALERGIMKSLAQIYAACHRHGAHGPSASQDAIWQSFDMQAALADTLVRLTIPGTEATSPVPQASPAVQSPPPAAPPVSSPIPQATAEPVQPPATPPADQSGTQEKPQIFQAPPSKPVEPPPVPPPAPAAPPVVDSSHNTSNAGGQAPANPMGFFAKKPDDGAQSASPAPPTTPPIQPPVAQPAEPPPPPPTAPPAPPAAPVQSSGNQGGGAANPMGFFVKKDDSAGEQATPTPPPAAPPQAPPPPPAAPPIPPAAPDDGGGQPQGNSSNPMSFFTKKEEDDS